MSQAESRGRILAGRMAATAPLRGTHETVRLRSEVDGHSLSHVLVSAV